MIQEHEYHGISRDVLLKDFLIVEPRLTKAKT